MTFIQRSSSSHDVASTILGRQLYNVALLSMRRHNVILELLRRRIHVMCSLGIYFVFEFFNKTKTFYRGLGEQRA